MTASPMLTLAVFLMVSSLVLLLAMLVGGRKTRLDDRLDGLAGKGGPGPEPDPVAQLARSALPRMGTPLLPRNDEERTRLQARLIHAGLYGRQAMVVFLGTKMLLMVAPLAVGLAAGALELVPLFYGLVIGIVGGIVGMIGPSFWLDRRKARRQLTFRRALPDALDVLVICLEGGISLTGALRRVAGELRTAHPLLAAEFRIVEREVQLGRPTGEALRSFADRADLEEVRSLASVITQAERFGAGLAHALRVNADTLRTKRLQNAEERAQRAATLLLIPTILFIFPGIFVVILAPAVIQLMQLFADMKLPTGV